MSESGEKPGREMLLRYLSSAGSNKERRDILKWLEDTSGEREAYRTSEEYWDSISEGVKTDDYNGAYLLDRIYHKIKLEEGVFVQDRKPMARLITKITRFAAVLAIPLIIITLFLAIQNRSYRNSVSWAEISAPFGTRTDFLLPDGSKGQLNGGSSLKFPIRFSGKTRDVKLSGEAFFDVVSDKSKPFIVSTKDIDVRVTGTTFNITAYSDEPVSEVTLKSGVVEVLGKAQKGNGLLGRLKPNDQLTFNSSTNSMNIVQVNVANKLSWLEGRLTFKYEQFTDVVKKLNRWYNVDIIIKDKDLESYIYYGTFQNETFDEVLKLLKYTAPITFKDLPRKQSEDGTFSKRQVELYSRNK